MASEEGRVSGVKSGAVSAFCISSFPANNADAVVDAGTNKVIFLHHSAGKNTCFDLFPLSVSNSETDGCIFMLIAHGNAPFVLAVAAGVIDNLTATEIYS